MGRHAGMKRAFLRFYEELNLYLPREKRKREFACLFEGRIAVWRLIEAVGVKMPLVDLILCNGESVSPEHRLSDGDRVSIYPVFESFDIKGTTRVRDEPLRRPRFLVTEGLERLAAYLRMMGFDTLGSTGDGLEADAALAETGQRILISRGPAESCPGPRAILVLNAKPREQAREVLSRFDLVRLIAPLARCPQCNRQCITRAGITHCECCGGDPLGAAHLRRVRILIGCLTAGCENH